MAMASSTHQKGIANSIVSGVKNYLSRSSISYASDGSTNVDAPDDDQPEETTAAETSAPEETTVPSDSSESETTAGSSDTTLPPETTSDTSAPSWNDAPADNDDTAETTVSTVSPETSTTEVIEWSDGGIPSV